LPLQCHSCTFLVPIAFRRVVEQKNLSKIIWCRFPQKFSVSCSTTFFPSRYCCRIPFFAFINVTLQKITIGTVS
jgi:hypothetical protein